MTSSRLRPIFVLVATLALATGCQPGNDAAAPPAAASGAGNDTSAPSPGDGAPPAGDPDAFCALAKEKGAENLVKIQDQSAAGGDSRDVLANLDAITAAAPSDIKPDFTRLDTLEHALLGGKPDQKTIAQAESPDTIASLQRIAAYLSDKCGISG
jgi:hypothetical protein